MKLNVDQRSSSDYRSRLTRWAVKAIGLPQVRVQIRLRGNHLHLLCEGPQKCPDLTTVMLHLVQALLKTDINSFLPADQPQIYHVLLYGRVAGSKRPDWTEVIFLNQLDRHLEQLLQSGMGGHALSQPQPEPPSTLLEQPTFSSPNGELSTVHEATAEARGPESSSNHNPQTLTPVLERPLTSTTTGSALIVSNRSLARQGYVDAIARYLSETLSVLEVGVKVKAKALPYSAETVETAEVSDRRLLILCESVYSPDPSLLSEPIAHKLRDLELEGFRDAIIISQVSGESRPEWTLRVDLTPPEEMLKEWARWGDLQAMTRLLNQALSGQGTEITAELRDVTLHIFCKPDKRAVTPSAQAQVPDKQALLPKIATLLETLAPQGVHAATVYGQDATEAAPAWIDWLNLPAAIHPALAPSSLELAQQGDQPAIAFLLSRLLNPNLDWRLATGGLRIQILPKDDLWHIMIDGPACPPQKQVGPPVTKLLRQLRIPKVSGVRVYGRRSGQKRPLWSYGVDFVPRQRLVPEATPEFAASESYVNDLLAYPEDESLLRPELTPEDLPATLTHLTHQAAEWLQEHFVEQITRLLIRSQLFVPNEFAPGDVDPAIALKPWQSAKVAALWGVVGLMVTFQTDWVLSQILQPPDPSANLELNAVNAAPEPSPLATPQPPRDLPLPPISLKKSQSGDAGIFNNSGFTELGNTDLILDNSEAPSPDVPTAPRPLKAAPLKASAATAAILAAARSSYPTFNSRQLDEKLALYQQRVSEMGGPPDVLIIGSSRALRGVDPAALENALAAQGYPGLRVFNFGVNGATAQVVDLIIRQILPPEQLPKLILWADGARAMNSGRVDITYNAIAVSEGYKALDNGTLPSLKPEDLQPADASGDTSDAGEGTPTQATKTTGPSLAEHYRTVDGWLNRNIAVFSGSYGERDRLKTSLREAVASLIPKVPASEMPAEMAALQPPVDGVDGEIMSLHAVDFDGFLPLDVRFNPATYYQKYAKVSGSYDGDYDAFQLEGKQTEALRNLLQFTQSRQISVVFVNTPLHREYLDPVRSNHEQDFLKHMLSLSTQAGFVFRDLGQLWPSQNDYFSDPSHLNRYGAYEVSSRLAQDPMISWPRPRK